MPYHGSPMGSVNLQPGDNRSIYGDQRSMYGGDAQSAYAGSLYGQLPLEHRASNYSLAGAPHPQMAFDPRASSYSLAGAPHPQMAFDPRTSSYSLMNAPPQPQEDFRASSFSVASQSQAPSRPASRFLPELSVDTTPVILGGPDITDAQLESSITRICAGANLDQLTKKGVRKQLEMEYGVGLGSRKEAINKIIEKVLSGEFAVVSM